MATPPVFPSYPAHATSQFSTVPTSDNSLMYGNRFPVPEATAPPQRMNGYQPMNYEERFGPAGYGQAQGWNYPPNNINPAIHHGRYFVNNPNWAPIVAGYGSTQGSSYSFGTMSPATPITTGLVQTNVGYASTSGANYYSEHNAHNSVSGRYAPLYMNIGPTHNPNPKPMEDHDQQPATKKRKVAQRPKPEGAKRKASSDTNPQPLPKKNSTRRKLPTTGGNQKSNNTSPLPLDTQSSPPAGEDSATNHPVAIDTGNEARDQPRHSPRDSSSPLRIEGNRYTLDGKEYFDFTYHNHSLDSPDQDTLNMTADDDLNLSNRLQDLTWEEFCQDKSYSGLLD